jgi:hypothetical protein
VAVVSDERWVLDEKRVEPLKAAGVERPDRLKEKQMFLELSLTPVPLLTGDHELGVCQSKPSRRQETFVSFGMTVA